MKLLFLSALLPVALAADGVSTAFDLASAGCTKKSTAYPNYDTGSASSPVSPEECRDYCGSDSLCALAEYTAATSTCAKKSDWVASNAAYQSGVEIIFPDCVSSGLVVANVEECMHENLDHYATDIFGTTSYDHSSPAGCKQHCLDTFGCVMASYLPSSNACIPKSAFLDLPRIIAGSHSVYADCDPTPWSEWSTCSRTCGYGIRSRQKPMQTPVTQTEYCPTLPACPGADPAPRMEPYTVSSAAAAHFSSSLEISSVDVANDRIHPATYCALTCLIQRGDDPNDRSACNAYVTDTANLRCHLGVVTDLQWLLDSQEEGGTDVIHVDMP